MRHHDRYSSQAHQVVGGHGELELLIDASQTTKYRLSNATNGLAPTEGLLDPFADDLADAVTRMAGSTAVDRAAAATGIVGSYVGRDLALATPGHRKLAGFSKPSQSRVGAGHLFAGGARQRCLLRGVYSGHGGAIIRLAAHVVAAAVDSVCHWFGVREYHHSVHLARYVHQCSSLTSYMDSPEEARD